jgi:hypothetical protein
MHGAKAVEHEVRVGVDDGVTSPWGCSSGKKFICTRPRDCDDWTRNFAELFEGTIWDDSSTAPEVIIITAR